MQWFANVLPLAREYAPLGAAIIAVVSLGFAISSRRLAGRAYRLAEQKEARQAPLLEVDVIEALQHLAANRDQRIDVHVQITNRSEVATSIRDVRISVQHQRHSRRLVEEVTPAARTARGNPLNVPIALSARETTQGWLRFELAAARIADWRVSSYDLIVRDVDARPTRFDGLALKREP